MELLVAPETPDDVHPDIADIVRVLHLIAGRLQNPAQRYTETTVPQVPDVKCLVRVRLRVLHHHPLGQRRTAAVRLPPRQHFPDQAGSDRTRVEIDVDVAINRLDPGESVGRGRRHPRRNLLRQLLRPAPDPIGGAALRLFLRQSFEVARRFELPHHDVVRQRVTDR